MLNNPQVRMAMRGAIAAKANGPGGPGAALKGVAAEVGLQPIDVGKALDKSARKDARFANQRRTSKVEQDNNANASANKNMKSDMDSDKNRKNSTSQHNRH